MRVLVIYCHPVTESFAAVAHTVALEALRHSGHAAIDVDLYADAFGPVMSRQDRIKAAYCHSHADSDESSRRFRLKPATCSDGSQPVIPTKPAGVAERTASLVNGVSLR
jgi:putative NADPH-quinone reductase